MSPAKWYSQGKIMTQENICDFMAKLTAIYSFNFSYNGVLSYCNKQNMIRFLVWTTSLLDIRKRKFEINHISFRQRHAF